VILSEGEEQDVAQRMLKMRLITSPALKPIDYGSEPPVILAVRGIFLVYRGVSMSAAVSTNPKQWTYSRFRIHTRMKGG